MWEPARPSPAPRGHLARAFPAFQYSDYRALWIGSGASSVALWATLMTRAWIALDLTDTGFAVGLVTFAAMAPWVLAPFGGALADRVDRGRLLIWARVATLLITIALAVLALTGEIAMWNLVLLAAASGLTRAVEHPAEQALIPNTVDQRALLNAITLTSLALFGSRLIGPLAGAPMLSGIGPGWVFVLAAGFSVISIVAQFRVRVRSTGELSRASGHVLTTIAHNLHEGLAYAGRDPSVRMVIALLTLHCLLAMSFDTLLPLLAKRELQGGAGLFGALLMGIGGGALVSTLGLSIIVRGATRGALYFTTGVLSGVGVVWLGLAPTPAQAVAAATVTGAAQAIYLALATTMVQSVVPDGLRGRVLSLFTLFGGGSMSVMSFANGAIADVISVRLLMTVPALGFVVVVVAWSLAGRDLRFVYRTGKLRALPEPAAA